MFWVGADGANASVASNWSTTNPTSCSTNVTPSGAIPGASDQMNFDADCDNSSVIDSGFSSTVSQIVLSSGYAGTVTLSNPLTVGSTMTISGGIFNGTSSLTVTSTLTVSGGTASFGSFSTYIQNGNVTVSSGTLTVPNGADLNGTDSTDGLQVSGGTFNAPSGTMTLAGGFRVLSGTFNANGGTFTIDGNNTATISCANATFNLVTFNHGAAGSAVKTVSSNCSALPLGTDPTINGSITLNGTLAGSGTLTYTTSTRVLTMNAGSSLSGFSGFSGATLTVAGATADFSGYSSFSTSGNVTLSSGSLTLPNGADLNGAISITAGTFNAPSGTMTLASNLSISGTPTFNANGGTIIFDSSLSGTLSCNNVTFNLVVFNNVGSKVVNSNCSLPLGNNPTVASTVTLNGTFAGSGKLSQALGTLALNSGAVLSGFNAFAGVNLTVSGATIDFTNYSPVSLTGVFTLSSGSFTAPSGNMTVRTNFTHSGGTFNHNNGTLTLDGNNQTISGETTFYNFTKTISGTSRTLTFPAGATQTITGTTTLRGDNGTLSLRSSTTGTQWRIDPQGSRNIYNLNVQDSWNTNSSVILAGGTGSVDSGNNTNWDFSTFTLSFFLDYPPGGSHITNSVPTFRWKKATTGSGTSVTKYELWIDDPASTHDYYVDNIQPSYPTNQSQDFLTYSIKDDGDYLNLTPKNYSLNTGKNNWRVMAHDSAGNTREESVDFYLDPATQTITYSNPTSTGTIIPISTPIPSPTPEASPEPTPIENIFNNPSFPTITENVSNWFDNLINQIKNLGPELQKLFSSFTVFVAANQSVIQKTSAIALIGLAPLVSVALIVSNLSNTSLSWNFIVRSLQALGILPKGKPMGTVHEALTSVGVAFAVLTLKGVGEGVFTTETFVSDSNGIYHGAKFPVGQYKLTANHQDYNFPTKVQKPMYLTAKDYYRGEVFTITDPKSDHFLSIPMDSRTNTNTKMSLRRRFSLILRGVLSLFEKISKLLFWPFAVLSFTLFTISPNVINGVIAGIYIVVIIAKMFGIIKSWFPTFKGKIVDENGKPLADTLVKIMNTKEGRVVEVTKTNKQGIYKLYSQKDKYQISAIKNGYLNTQETAGNYIEAKNNLQIKLNSY